MTLGKATSNRSLPIDATTTKVHATPEAAPSPRPISLGSDSSYRAKINDVIAADEPDRKKEDARPEKGSTKPNSPPQEPTKSSPTEATSPTKPGGQDGQVSWIAWLSRRDGGGTVKSAGSVSAGDREPGTQPLESAQRDAKTNSTGDQAPEETQAQSQLKGQSNDSTGGGTKRSWLQMWSNNDANNTANRLGEPSNGAASLTATQTKSPNVEIPTTPAKSTSQSQASSIETSPPPALPGDSTKSSGWVFWSRERKSGPSESQAHVGEIAISDTPSQTRPKRASISLPGEKDRPGVKTPQQAEQAKKATVVKAPAAKAPVAKAPAVKATSAQDGNGEPSETKGPKRSDAKEGATTKAKAPNATTAAREPAEASTPRTGSPVPSKKEGKNLLLPLFKDTLSPRENASILQQLARLLFSIKEPELKHLSIVKDRPGIKNALSIGVHGYFPAPLIRTVLGQPTGTSIKFADMAAKAIQRWAEINGYECHVKSAALEGEGKIAERVEMLWKLLLNWIDEIRKSDFVMIACHSQGVPVAIMLVAKLIQFGCVNSARLGICAMAGVNMGPFLEYKSRWISGSAGELFEFSDPNSKVSTDYRAALATVLQFGVRVTFVGSIDDQLVSLESSIFSPITHPHIYRAVLIDSRVHAPNFLSHLVGFALKLRNLGVQDHGLIRELSSPLAGSLYTGEGHSRIYEDDAVYDLAVAFALETNSLVDVPVSERSNIASAGNPYILPFAMRGILEEDFVKNQLHREASELLAQFDEWKPTTKVLKDVKFRLEGIRSKI